MDTAKVRALLAAVDLGSISKAAEALGYTQSGVTHMMRSLEEEAGFPLLLRGNRGVTFTPDGERLAPLFRALSRAADKLEPVSYTHLRSYFGAAVLLGLRH